MMCVHADWAVGDDDGFRDVLLAAERVAVMDSALVTVGVVPTAPTPASDTFSRARELTAERDR